MKKKKWKQILKNRKLIYNNMKIKKLNNKKIKKDIQNN